MKIENARLEAISIGEKLIASCLRDVSGTFWSLNAKSPDESIYTGNSGINLFFQELYLCTGDEKYRILVEDNIEWMIAQPHHGATDFSLYNGRAGFAYCLLMAVRVSRKKKLLLMAARICKQSLPFLKGKDQSMDLLGGVPGTILVLCHLYLSSPKEWILKYIRTGLFTIFQMIEFSNEGPYWNRSPYFIRGLCGLSHGSSGMAFIFFELFRFFGERQFLEMSKQLLLYESRLFNKKHGNWPYSMVPFEGDLSLLDVFKKFEGKGFNDRYDHVAWCHGAPGIGISRVHIYGTLRENLIKKEIVAAYAKTIKILHRPTISHCLCHGLAGNFFLFIHMHRESLLNSKSYQQLRRKILRTLESQKEINGNYWTGGLQPAGDDLGLFTGVTGIGYFYTQLLRPNGADIMLPRLEFGKKLGHVKSKFSITSAIIARIFPRLSIVLNKIKLMSEFLRSCPDQLSSIEIISFTKDFIRRKQSEPLSHLMSFEFTIYRMRRAKKNNFLFSVNQLQLKEAAKPLGLRLLGNGHIHLILNPILKLKKMNYEINSLTQDPLQSKRGNFYYILSSGANLQELEISRQSYEVLRLFKSSLTLAEFLELLDTRNNLTRKKIKDQIINFVNASFIIEAKR